MEVGNYDLSSFQYAFSTIAQTIATGFALLTAVVMYRLQSMTATFPGRARSLESNLAIDKPVNVRTAINLAYEKGDWDGWLAIANQVGFPSGLDEMVLKSERARLEGLKEEITRIAAIKQQTGRALSWTAYTIAGALIMIMLMNKAIICCFPAYLIAWITVIADTAAAIGCLWKYRPLVLEVIKPVQRRESGSKSY